MRFRWPLLLALSIAESALAENVVDVIGVRRESRELDRPGRSESITPEQSSRFELNRHLQERSSFASESNGKISASGFLLPRTRGQGAKATAVFLGDLQLFDPLTGFPLVDDLDMRAFGRFTIHRGVSPIELPTTNPIGSIVIRPRLPYKDRLGLGVLYGQPQGLRSYALIDHGTPTLGARLYARRHQTSGRYTFFDDNATPANRSDDGEAEREDNFSTSQQIVPLLRWDSGPHLWRYTGIFSIGKRGVPSLGGRATTGAHTEATSYVQSTKYSYQTGASGILPASLGIAAHYRHEVRRTVDPRRAIFVTRDEQGNNLYGGSATIPVIWEWLHGKLHLTLGHGQASGGTTDVQTGEVYRLRRTYEQIHLGVRHKFAGALIAEAKSRWRTRTDLAVNARDKHEDKGASLSLGLEIAKLMFYFQAGREERPPALFEQYGDGASLLPSPSLQAENVTHREAGLTWGSHLTFTYFQDDTEEKIVFIPSFANAFKAVNLQATRIRGIEAAANYDLPYTRLSLGWTGLDAKDLSTPDHKTAVPRIPRHTVNGGITGQFAAWTIRSLTRYRGTAYADVLEQAEIPAATTHDLSVDWQRGDSLSCSASIFNLTNLRAVDYDVPGTGEKGRRPRSELSGYPLPGRTWSSGCDFTF